METILIIVGTMCGFCALETAHWFSQYQAARTKEVALWQAKARKMSKRYWDATHFNGGR